MIDRKKRKKFGQNYLIDPVTIHKIIKSIGLDHQLPYLEIGPGHGAITDGFIEAINNYSAVEIDHENIEFLLKKYRDQQINLISQDILSFNFESLPENVKIIGNLPYNIASQIIIKILTSKVNPKDLHFMVQKEMAEVITSSPGSKSWNKFAVKVAFFYETEILMDISPEAFDIKPKVDSSLVRFKPINSQAFEIKKLFQIIDLSFQSKRKTIFNNLKNHNINWEKLKFDKNLRAEQLSLEDFLEIYKNA